MGREVMDPMLERALSTHNVLNAIAAMSERWHRITRSSNCDDFDSGRAAGYVQAIADLTGLKYSEIHKELREGRL